MSEMGDARRRLKRMKKLLKEIKTEIEEMEYWINDSIQEE